MNIEIEKIRIVYGIVFDDVFLATNLPSTLKNPGNTWAEQLANSKACLLLKLPKGTAEEYCRVYFPDIPVEIIT